MEVGHVPILPRMEPNEPRVARTSSSVLLSESERRLIRTAAHRSETSLSDYMRRVSVAQAEADLAVPQLFDGGTP